VRFIKGTPAVHMANKINQAMWVEIRPLELIIGGAVEISS